MICNTAAGYVCVERKSTQESLQIDIAFCGLLRSDEAIQYVRWNTSPGLVVDKQLLPPDEHTVSCVVSGGTAGQTYTVCAEVHTTRGQIDQRCALLAVYSCFEQSPVDLTSPDVALTASHTFSIGGTVGDTSGMLDLIGSHEFATGGVYLDDLSTDLEGSHDFDTVGEILNEGEADLEGSHEFTITGSIAGETMLWEDGDSLLWEDGDTIVWEST